MYYKSFSYSAVVEIHAGVERGHREREPRAGERGESHVGVETAEPVHGGVAEGDGLPRPPEGEPDVGHAHPGPGHPVVRSEALSIETLGGKLVAVGADRGQLQPLLHVLQQLVHQVVTVSISKNRIFK